MKVFPWISGFFSEITAFGDQTTHSLSEYENKYGTDYSKRLPSRYWIHFGGRALKTFADLLGTRPYEEILSAGKGGCGELLDASHFHLDLFGNYVPGLCSGLAIHRDDLGHPVPPESYPFLHTLFDSGVTGLFELVSKKYDFKPCGSYMSKCHLCLDIRRHLVLERGLVSRDLQPKGFYENV